MKFKSKHFPSDEVFSRALFQIAKALELNHCDLTSIFAVDIQTIHTWEAKQLFPSSDEVKLSVLLDLVQIYQHLSAIFSNNKDRVLWLRAFHPQLEQVPFELMLNSSFGLKDVKEYLEAARMRGA